MNWQSIDTAPKDGQTILVCGPRLLHSHGWGIATVSWGDGEDGGIRWWKVDDGKHGPYDLRGPSPTHWMPLPEPPETA